MKTHAFERYYWRIFVISGIWLLSGLILPSQVCASSAFTTRVVVYQGLDIDDDMTAYDSRALVVNFGSTGRIDPVLPQLSFEFIPSVDVHFEFAAGNGSPVRLFLDNSVQAAVFRNTAFGALNVAALPPLAFNASPFGLVFDADDTIVLLTTAGNMFVLGGFTYHTLETAVQFTARQLRPIPEASTLLLGSIGLLLMAVMRKSSIAKR